MNDPFPGIWELDPESLDYQFGGPGRRALYTIEAIPGGLQFSLDGNDADGNHLKFTYGGELEGRDQPIPGVDAVLVLKRLSDNVIESTLKRNGQVVDRWTREILPDGNTMRIIQHVVRPNGDEFKNTSLYRRVK